MSFGQEMKCDIAVIGGGTGGCAAALAACRMGKRVVMTEETAWIGGQLTSQAVPPDEHRWIEQFGCTRSYRRFRDGVRDYYRRHIPLAADARDAPFLNPGGGIVSALCYDPRVGVAVLEQMLAPYILSGRLTILRGVAPERAETSGDRIDAVTVRDKATGRRMVLRAACFLDATECGDLLPLAGAEYVTGAESAKETGEPHALPGEPEPLTMQSFTCCMAIDYKEGRDDRIGKPKDYDFWRAYQAPFQKDCLFSWTWEHPRYRSFSLLPEEERFSLFLYRQIADRFLFVPGMFETSVSIVNWPQNDYWLGPLFEVGESERERHLEQARQLSLSLLYWLQHDAPRPDGGTGYPGVGLRPDVTGTADGLAMYPYIRESRRIRAEFTVLEQHVSALSREGRGAERFADSIGIGFYPIDIHPRTGNRDGLGLETVPFQIPLGSLLPVRLDNLLPACKNGGFTHITNGCYRLHPIEWNIGEAAGYLAACCLDRRLPPRAVRSDTERLGQFQSLLVREGLELAWPQLPSMRSISG